MIAVLYVAAVLAVCFVVSGVVCRYPEARRRRLRIAAFRDQYREWADAAAGGWTEDQYDLVGTVMSRDAAEAMDASSSKAAELRPWLVARRDEMQRDAQAVGRGVVGIAPPPAIGGHVRNHAYFSDLFDEQTYSEVTGGSSFKLDELATILHETEREAARRRRDLCNPWSWIRLAFERIVRFPSYVLRVSGFGTAVTDSTGVRAVSTVWSFAVGVTTIAGFIYAVASGG